MHDSVRFIGTSAVLAAAIWAAASPAGSTPGQAEQASGDSIVATARFLSGETGGGPPSRFAPLPETAFYVEYLASRLDAALDPLGGSASLMDFDPGFETLGGDTIRSPYRNVIGVVPGSLPGRPGFFLVGAHLDATAQRDPEFEGSWRTHPAPGADDNASGVAAILEAARVAAVRQIRPEANLVFAFFDGEEQQIPEPDKFLLGAETMAADVMGGLEDAYGPLYGFVNLDMVAYNPRLDSLVVLTNVPSRWLANRMVDLEAAAPLADFTLTRAVEALAFSDHGPFWAHGYSAVLLIESPDIQEHAPHYHRATDVVDNVYLRGGSQARRASDLLLLMLESWAEPEGASGLAVSGDDLLVTTSTRVDAPVVASGDSVRVRVGVVNSGATRSEPWRVGLGVEIDGRIVETFDPVPGTVPFPAGAHEFVEFDWVPTNRLSGSPRLVARIEADGNDPAAPGEVKRFVAVQGDVSEILRAFVYPNPTRLPDRAVLHYELSRQGAVRLTLLDLSGRELGMRDLRYDPVFPGPGVGVGAADLPLRDLFPTGDLAPGMYLLRIELFDETATRSVAVEVTRWALLR